MIRLRTVAIFSCLAFPFVVAASEPARQTAEWVLHAGGRVMVNGDREVIDDLSKLPTTPFRLTAVDLIGTTIDPKDLAKLSGLESLTELSLPGPIFTPYSDSPLDANETLKSLAGLTHLERLFFSLHFLPTYNVDDQGIRYLATLTQLHELRLSQSHVKTPDLSPFTKLESLDLSDCPYFGDAGTLTLAKLKGLRRLYLRNTPITDDGLKNLSELTNLEDLDLYGNNSITDRGIESLRKLTALRRLNLLGAEVSDTGAAILAGLPRLQSLNLYRSHVGNTGLANLEQLKELAVLDIRYSRVTDAGVEALRAALPNCSVEYAGGIAVGAANVAVTQPAGNDDLAISEWVRKLGGKAELRQSRLVHISLAATRVTDAQLSYLSALSSLEHLNLDATQVGDLGLRSLSSLKSLQTLSLNQTGVSDAGLEALKNLGQLRTLRLSGTQVRGSGLESLRSLSQLTELDLTSAPINDNGLKQIAALSSLEKLYLSYSDITGVTSLEKLTHLQVLELNGTDLGDAALVSLGKLTELRELGLNSCRFTNKGVPSLATLSHLERLDLVRTSTDNAGIAAIAALSNLSTLNLDYTSVDDRALPYLKKLTKIRTLHLNMAKVSDAAVDDLASMTTLKNLNLYHTLVTEKGLARLKSALPNCGIVFDRDSALPARRGRG